MTAEDLPIDIDVMVIGGGQAGLAISYELAIHGIEHVVLERGRIAESWANLWDGFFLNTPNWSVELPGFPYRGDDSEAFMSRSEIVDRLRDYAGSFEAPVIEGVEVLGLESIERGFKIQLEERRVKSRSVVVCTGAYQRTHIPGEGTLPDHLATFSARTYRSPESLPDGAVLVIGGGQSGLQIAEELCDTGIETLVSCGKVAWAPRRMEGQDLLWWARETGFLDETITNLPSPLARFSGNVTASGNNGGHDLHARTLRRKGAILVGRYEGVRDGAFRFASDLAESVAWGDARYQEIAARVRSVSQERGLPEPDLPDPEPFDPTAPLAVPTSGVGAVIYAGGFRPDYGWIRVPGAFDELGFPVQYQRCLGRSAGAVLLRGPFSPLPQVGAVARNRGRRSCRRPRRGSLRGGDPALPARDRAGLLRQRQACHESRQAQIEHGQCLRLK